MRRAFVLFLFLTIANALAWGTVETRRTFLPAVCCAMIVTPTVLVAPDLANAILSSKYCGDGCEDRSEGNEFIKSLQEKSALNREAYRNEATRAYQMKNYPDYFNSIGKFMVMKEDGTFLVLSEKELADLRQAGKIKMVKPTAFKGQVLDYTQKPIRILVE